MSDTAQPNPTTEGFTIHLVYINEHLKSLDTKMTAMASNTVNRDEWVALLKKVESDEGDIEKLKTFRDTLTGKMVVIGVFAGAAMSFLGLVISHYWK
jgi:hypothetical protein